MNNQKSYVILGILLSIVLIAGEHSSATSGFKSHETSFENFDEVTEDAMAPFEKTTEQVLNEIEEVTKQARAHIEYSKAHPDDRTAHARAVDSTMAALKALDQGLEVIQGTEPAVLAGIQDARDKFFGEVEEEEKLNEGKREELEKKNKELQQIQVVLTNIADEFPRGSQLPSDVEEDIRRFHRTREILTNQVAGLRETIASADENSGIHEIGKTYFANTETSLAGVYHSIGLQRVHIHSMADVVGAKVRGLLQQIKLKKVWGTVQKVQAFDTALRTQAGSFLTEIKSILGQNFSFLPDAAPDEPQDILDEYRDKKDPQNSP